MGIPRRGLGEGIVDIFRIAGQGEIPPRETGDEPIYIIYILIQQSK